MIKTLEDFNAYNMAMDMGESIWRIVKTWKYLEQDTVGKQWVRTADSIASNLSEGLGMFHNKEAKNIAYFSRGSLFETKTWITKAFNRGLITNEQFSELMSTQDILCRMINKYINSIGKPNNGKK